MTSVFCLCHESKLLFAYHDCQDVIIKITEPRSGLRAQGCKHTPESGGQPPEVLATSLREHN